MIGIYWANHHYIFRLYERSDHAFVLLNILFLMCISFLPFPTAVLAEHIAHPGQRQNAIPLYALGLLLPAFAWFLVWWYASRRNRLLNPDLDPGFVKSLTKTFAASVVLYSAALLISLWSGLASLAVCVRLTSL